VREQRREHARAQRHQREAEHLNEKVRRRGGSQAALARSSARASAAEGQRQAIDEEDEEDSELGNRYLKFE
jgi:hypothetical protein